MLTKPLSGQEVPREIVGAKTRLVIILSWSDARLKKNIMLYTSGLKEIMKINPVCFQYNELSGEEDLDKN